MRKPISVRELDPALALRSGTSDARAVLLLWCYRKAWLPLLWIGLIAMTLAGIADPIAEAEAGLTGIGDWLPALVTPLAGVILALVVRLTAGWLALLLAYPLSRWTEPLHYPHRCRALSRSRLWIDRLYLTRAYGSLRWSWAVRQLAAEHLGDSGRRLMLCNPIMAWANVVLIAAFILIYTLT